MNVSLIPHDTRSLLPGHAADTDMVLVLVQRFAGTNGAYRPTHKQEMEEKTRFTEPNRKAALLEVRLPHKSTESVQPIW